MSGIRVIGGIARGRRLKTRKVRHLRPATDYVKEALFNILVMRVPGSTFLDLFAGTGGIGIEALSRGARRAVFVERDPQNAALIKENLQLTGFTELAEIYSCDVFRAIPRLGERGYCFDLIFVDPPFRHGLLQPVLESLNRARLLRSGGLLITRSAFGEENLVLASPVREARYGDSVLRFYEG